MFSDVELQKKYRSAFRTLDERNRRLLAAADSVLLGYGGVSKVARTSGLARSRIHRGIAELTKGGYKDNRVRCMGGGRKGIETVKPTIRRRLEELVAPTTRGDPMSPLKWTNKSTRRLAESLKKAGYSISHSTVGDLLHKMEYSLQANSKTVEGKDHPDRDAQFQYINQQVRRYLRKKDPVISIDTKKKELIGNYKNAGQQWRPKASPQKVLTHDFPDKKLGKVIPYGVYDIGQDTGWVSVGIDHDTSAFAIESIRGWWCCLGRKLYPHSRRLLMCADAGGSNGYRNRLWKVELKKLATDTGLDISVCHFPPGTSKWNKIEHRLFSQISMNWKGRPLVSHEVILNLIGATSTRSGLKVKAKIDKRTYPTKIRITDEELLQVNVRPHKFHGEWNYTITPGVNKL